MLQFLALFIVFFFLQNLKSVKHCTSSAKSDNPFLTWFDWTAKIENAGLHIVARITQLENQNTFLLGNRTIGQQHILMRSQYLTTRGKESQRGKKPGLAKERERTTILGEDQKCLTWNQLLVSFFLLASWSYHSCLFHVYKLHATHYQQC